MIDMTCCVALYRKCGHGCCVVEYTTIVEYMGHSLASIVKLCVRWLNRGDAACKLVGLDLVMRKIKIRGSEIVEEE